jgi:hypothetical protein
MQRVSFPRRLWFLIVLFSFASLLASCRNTAADTQGPQVLSTMPQGWTPMTTERGGLFSRGGTTVWTQINIDNDLATEYLLYFTYDNEQVGAIIYDQQAGATGANSPTPIPAPNQPAGQYVSYQVEPSFWTRSDAPDTVGLIAPPNTAVGNLRVEQVQRYPAGEPGQAGTANPDPGENVPPTNELIIYGGPTVISVLWWRNTFNGYGIAQMQATGGLEPQGRVAGDIPRPLEQVIGETPLNGLLARSVLCRETRFTRTDTGEPEDIVQPVYQNAVRYVESDGGIVFCNGAPASPYYPEGVVLAYLRPEPAGATESVAPSPSLLWSGLDDAQRSALAAGIDLNGPSVAGTPPLVVRDLRARASIPLPADFRTTASGSITTNVCAEVVSEDGLTLRRLLFDLVYEPVQESGGVILPERFSIARITDITDVFVNCALIIP